MTKPKIKPHQDNIIKKSIRPIHTTNDHEHEWIEPEVYSDVQSEKIVKVEISWFCKDVNCNIIRKKKQVFDLEEDFADERIDNNDFYAWEGY